MVLNVFCCWTIVNLMGLFLLLAGDTNVPVIMGSANIHLLEGLKIRFFILFLFF